VQDQDPADFDPRLGKQLGVYIVVARVADGAMGRVYEGRHPDTKARVAIKVLHEHVVRDRVAVERFKREYETALELSNPYIVKVHEFGQSPDQSYFMTMEYLEGEELSKAIAPRKPLPFARIVRTVSQIALALEHAHAFGFIHRDLKPDNIFLCDTATGTQVRVLDFGSVKLQVETGNKLTALGTTLGSPYYMSPEQATGSTSVDQRSDVFALGAILYELLTGKTAFEAPTVALIVMKILNQTPPPPSSINPAASAAIDAVIERALRKDQNARYASARALGDGLIAALGLQGSCETWAEKPEAEVASALAAAVPPTGPVLSEIPIAPKPARSEREPEAKTVSAATPARSQPNASASSQPAPAHAPRLSRTSDGPLTVPMQPAKTKWLIAGALVLLAIGALILLSR
jgi:serine/threonine-protein kinase